MAVAVSAASTLKTTTNGTDQVHTDPGGSNGDLIVVVCFFSSATAPTVTGFTEQLRVNTGFPSYSVLTRVRDGTEGASFTVNGAPSSTCSSCVLNVTGANTSRPVGAWQERRPVETSTNPPAPGLYIPAGGFVGVWGWLNAVAWTSVAVLNHDTGTMSWTEVGEYTAAGNSSGVFDYGIASADIILSEANFSVSGGNAQTRGGFSFIIAPADIEDVFVTSTGAGSITAPGGASAVRLHAVGAGSGGGQESGAECGGGGGAFAETTSVAVTGGSSTVFYSVGTGGGPAASGGDSWARVGTNSAPTSPTDGVLAKGGTGAATGGGTGGLAASSVGNAKADGVDGAIDQGGGGSRGGSGGGQAGTLGTQGASPSAGSGATPGIGGSPGPGAGAGGDGGVTASSGVNGFIPGGAGGGGGNSGGNAGSGASGVVRLLFTLTGPAIGRADETDTAFTRGLTAGHGQSNETDTAFACTATVIRPTGLATETDSAFQRNLTHGVNRANETDSAFALSQGIVQLPVGQANEADTAFKAGGIAMAPNVSVETDTAFTQDIVLPVQRADETDTAFERERLGGVGVAIEADTALALGKLFILPIGRKPVANFDFSSNYLAEYATFDATIAVVAGRLRVTADQAISVMATATFPSIGAELRVGNAVKISGEGFAGTANATVRLSNGASSAPGQPYTNTSFNVETIMSGSASVKIDCSLNDLGAVGIGQFAEFDNFVITEIATEANTAFALARLDTGFVGRADETDSALALTVSYVHGFSTETDTAFALGGVFDMLPGRADEADTSLALTAVNIRPVGFISETDTARQPGFGQPALRANSTETAFARNALVTYAIGMATEIDTAFQMFGALEAGSGRKPHIRLDSILRDRVQPVHKVL